ncbi:MAG TPA: protein translocase subunit SecF [Dehalococcoidia bacterium]|nr:protein translocase subunit SecF [Dehalococcoidia bacterium]
MLDIVGRRGWYFLISGLIILPGLISLIIPPGWSTLNSGLNPGIDFTSGSVLDITFDQGVNQTQIQERMNQLGHPEALIQSTGSRSVLIRTKVLQEDTGAGVSERQRVQDDLEANVASIESMAFDSISPIVAQETIRNTFLALLAAAVFMLLYIWYAFRRAPKAYRYGVSAVIALAHDVLVVLGVFSILGRAIDLEVNTTFIIGILTVVGYSVNDTIVVFDRIRENVTHHPERDFASLVNLSIIETIGRSFNSQFTTLLVLLAMLFIGGPSIRGLLLAIAIGVVVGTYSSIFIAAQFLVIWERREFGRAWRWGRGAPAAAGASLMSLIGR